MTKTSLTVDQVKPGDVLRFMSPGNEYNVDNVGKLYKVLPTPPDIDIIYVRKLREDGTLVGENMGYYVWRFELVFPTNVDLTRPFRTRQLGPVLILGETGDKDRPIAATFVVDGVFREFSYPPSGMFYGRCESPLDLVNT